MTRPEPDANPPAEGQNLESGVYLRNVHPDIETGNTKSSSGDKGSSVPSSQSGVLPGASLPLPSPPPSMGSGLYQLGAPTPLPPSREIIESQESAIHFAPAVSAKKPSSREFKLPPQQGSIPKPLPPVREADLSQTLLKIYAIVVTAILVLLWIRSVLIDMIVGNDIP